MTRFFHGTTSARAAIIAANGFGANSYFTSSIEDARYYAATGGERDLQTREEAFHAEHGEWPRDLYDPWEMFRVLFPAGQHPTVLSVEFSEDALALAKPDSGAEGGLVFDHALPATVVAAQQRVEWPDESPLPSAPGPA
jgi:hypothetical protein